jgi:hypothetical protein
LPSPLASATSDGMQAGSAFVHVDLQFMQTLPNIQLSYLNHFYDQSSTIKAVALPPSNAKSNTRTTRKKHLHWTKLQTISTHPATNGITYAP